MDLFSLAAERIKNIKGKSFADAGMEACVEWKQEVLRQKEMAKCGDVLLRNDLLKDKVTDSWSKAFILDVAVYMAP